MTEKKPGVFITIRCTCGRKLGEIFGFFRLKCNNKPMHERQNVIVEGYTDQGQAVIEGITPEILP